MFSFPMAFNALISFETAPERLPSSAGNSKNKKNIIKNIFIIEDIGYRGLRSTVCYSVLQ